MRQRHLMLLCWSLALASPTGWAGEKKLIEFGWDEPDTRFMREHIREMEQTPFDGCVFHAQYARPKGRGDFIWECWGNRAFTEAELAPALEELKTTSFQKFTHNFLRFNTAPGTNDWFDDFTAVAANARLAARVAREGKCKGLLFDIEQYSFQLFKYRKQRDAGTKSWDDYAAQVRKRGSQVMQSFQEGYPGLTIFLTFGYSLPWVQIGKNKAKLPDADYGLLAPLLDGMVEAASNDVRFVDGHELSYGFKESRQYTNAYRLMQEEVLPIVANPQKYRKLFSFGFGVWMDNNQRKVGWNTNDFSTNYFRPPALEKSIRAALDMSDEYVWIYTEMPRWWTKGGTSQKLPRDYYDAVVRARESRVNEK